MVNPQITQNAPMPNNPNQTRFPRMQCICKLYIYKYANEHKYNNYLENWRQMADKYLNSPDFVQKYKLLNKVSE